MKRFSLIVFLTLISVAMAFATPAGRESGVGSPYSITASAANVIYKDLRSGAIWISNSTTKGDWTKLDAMVADGSASAPFDVLYAATINDGAVVSLTADEKTQALVGSTTVAFLAQTINGVVPLTAAEKDQALNGTDTLDLAAASINGVNVLTADERTQALVGSTTADFLAKKATISDVLKLTGLTADPATAEEGDIYHNSASHTLNIYASATWNVITITPY